MVRGGKRRGEGEGKGRDGRPSDFELAMGLGREMGKEEGMRGDEREGEGKGRRSGCNNFPFTPLQPIKCLLSSSSLLSIGGVQPNNSNEIANELHTIEEIFLNGRLTIMSHDLQRNTFYNYLTTAKPSAIYE